jgi:hypothetical protein
MRARLLLVAAVGATVMIGLAGCTGGDTVAPLTTTAPPASATATPSATATTSATDSPSPSASASVSPAVAADLARFDTANRGAVAAGSPNDHSIVDALAAAGFAKSDMQITPDTTTIGRAADSIEVAVRVGSTCLIGGFNGTAYTSDTAPALAGGKCLLGTTRAINW